MKKRTIQTNKTSYAGLQVRLTTNLIDLTILSILFLPLFAIISNFIYGDLIPAEVFRDITKEMEQISKNDPSFDALLFLHNNKQFQDFLYKDYGLVKIIVNFILQILIVSSTFLVFWIKKQATIGKSFMSLKIVDADTLGRPTNKQFILRFFGLIFSASFFLLGIIWIAFDPKKQGWHDKIANTIVIKEKK